MEMKVGLTYACMNLKKLAKIKAKRGLPKERYPFRISVLDAIYFIKDKWLWYTHQSRFVYTLWQEKGAEKFSSFFLPVNHQVY